MPKIIKHKKILPVAAALLATVLLSAQMHGDEKKVANTTVTVGEMCGGCVKRITAHFDKDWSVAKVKCDIEKTSVTLFPAKNVRLSPRKVWEIMESLGKKPKKLVGPDGTFTSKPKKA